MQGHTIKTIADKQIALTLFGASNVDRILIITPATGVKQTFYQNFAQYVAEHGVSVITFDYHGIGKSLTSPLKKVNSTAEEWGRDNLESVIQFVKEKFPQARIYLLGHSICGQLIGLAPSSSLAKNIILISAQSGYWKFWKGFDRYKLWSYWNILFPFLCRVVGYLPSRTFSKMENLPKGVAMEWSKWCNTPNYFFDYLPVQSLHFDSITADISSYSMDDDNLAPKSSVDWLTDAYKNANVKRLHLRPSDFNVPAIGHFGFFSLRFKETLWKKLLNDILN